MSPPELSKRALRDLRKIPRQERDRIAERIRLLGEDQLPANLDVDWITGHRPWQRLRVGDWRVVFLRVGETPIVARVIDRQYLERVVATLELSDFC